MTQEAAVKQFLTASSAMLDAAVLTARQDDPEGIACLAAAVRAGAMMRLSFTISAAGVAWVAVECVEPSGNVVPISNMELDYMAHTQPGGVKH